MGALARFFSWLLQKLAVAAALLALGVAGLGLWIFFRDRVDFDQERIRIIRDLTGQTRELKAALADVAARRAAMRVEIAAQEQRAAQAARVTAELADLNGGLNRLLGDQEQRRANEERIARMKQMEAEARARIVELQQALVREQWKKDGIEIALGKTSQELKAAEARKSKILHYVHEAWARYGPHVLVVLGLYLLGPSLARITTYYAFAPFVMRSQPVLLGRSEAATPLVTTSRAALDVALAPGDTLWVKEKFLQASDEGLRRKTRLVLDWRMPLTCAACGLVELIQMRNESAQAEWRVTFSSQESPHTELALVTLPVGASLVLRPSFLAGLSKAAGQRLRIRRHWRIFTWQSWITGQFRYFEFCGPCRLLVAGSRGVRAEVLEARVGAAAPARRTNQDATIGFTPGLAYRPVRAETFWAYFRGKNPLFDDLFEGCGVFLCQETSAQGDAEKARKFWPQVWSGVLRLFGV